MVQTGAKIQFGGLKPGLVKDAYQVGIAGVVKIEPTKPTSSQRTIAKTIFTVLTYKNKIKNKIKINREVRLYNR